MAPFDNFSGAWMTAFSSTLFAQAGADPVSVKSWHATRARVARPESAALRIAALPAVSVADAADFTDVDAGDGGHDPAIGSHDPLSGALSEEVFRTALVRERMRADRFDEVFALVTVSVGTGETPLAPSVAAAAAGALQCLAGDMGVVGWIRDGAVLAALLTDIRQQSADNTADALETEVRIGLERYLDRGAMAPLEIHGYVHAGPGAGGAQGLSDRDPLLDAIRSTEERRTMHAVAKRLLDIAGSLALLIVLSPLLLVIAAFVKLTSRGPVLFRQVRVGQLGRPFTMLKFRSMHTNSDSAIHQQFVTNFIKSGGQQPATSGGTVFKITNDPRITPIGHILRKTSLDELPQFWNVLRGEMSLVGPRPPLRYELEQYRSWHWRRVLEAKPGVTGLWQVEGRSRTTFDEMVRLDLRYARTRSLMTDVRILIATPRAVVSGKGAC